ncbi:hypothetical protein DMP21_15470 [Listeria monocytogenes]|nr:hypothetical protein [Listeria monocytogenes]
MIFTVNSFPQSGHVFTPGLTVNTCEYSGQLPSVPFLIISCFAIFRLCSLICLSNFFESNLILTPILPTSLHKNYSTVKGRTERRTKCQIYK